MSDQQQRNETPALRKSVIFMYGYEEFAFGFLTNLGTMYFAFFLTDVILIGPAIVATIMLVGRVVDAIGTPVAGFVVQASNFKSGKYSTWIFIATPLCMLFFMLMFSNFPLPLGPKSALMCTFYIIAYFLVAIDGSSRFSAMMLLTNDNRERMLLSSARGQGLTARNIVGGLIYVPIVTFLTKATGNQVFGYFTAAGIFGLVGISGMYWLAVVLRPYERAVQQRESAPVSLLDMLKQLGTNKPLLILFLTETMRYGATQSLISSNMYYFRYVIGNLMMLPMYMTITFIGGFIGNTITGILAKKVERKAIYITGFIIWILSMLLAFFISYSNVVLFIACVFIAQLGIGLSNSCVLAFFSDTSDYGEVMQGKNIRAINMGMMASSIKFGVMVGGTLQAYLLTVINFTAGTKDLGVIRGIHNGATLLPAGVALIAMLLMLAYPLNSKKMDRIHEQLKAMYAKKANA